MNPCGRSRYAPRVAPLYTVIVYEITRRLSFVVVLIWRFSPVFAFRLLPKKHPWLQLVFNQINFFNQKNRQAICLLPIKKCCQSNCQNEDDGHCDSVVGFVDDTCTLWTNRKQNRCWKHGFIDDNLWHVRYSYTNIACHTCTQPNALN